MSVFHYTESLTVVHCTCGIAFAIPSELERQACDGGKSICCPLGHKWHYTETLEAKLKREREKTARLIAQRDQIEASLRAQKGVTTRLSRKLKRVQSGVCPECNRSFQNLQRHMKTKHEHA